MQAMLASVFSKLRYIPDESLSREGSPTSIFFDAPPRSSITDTTTLAPSGVRMAIPDPRSHLSPMLEGNLEDTPTLVEYPQESPEAIGSFYLANILHEC
jgi:hypothetical protein